MARNRIIVVGNAGYTPSRSQNGTMVFSIITHPLGIKFIVLAPQELISSLREASKGTRVKVSGRLLPGRHGGYAIAADRITTAGDSLSGVPVVELEGNVGHTPSLASAGRYRFSLISHLSGMTTMKTVIFFEGEERSDITVGKAVIVRGQLVPRGAPGGNDFAILARSIREIPESL